MGMNIESLNYPRSLYIRPQGPQGSRIAIRVENPQDEEILKDAMDQAKELNLTGAELLNHLGETGLTRSDN